MARSTKKKAKTKRGSPEAIAKRRTARALNSLFSQAGSTAGLDGRSIKRRERLLRELKEGKGGEPLKAIEVLTHANELFTLGETLSSLRKAKPKVPGPAPRSEEADALCVEAQKLYGFDPKAWRLLGVDIEKLSGGAGEKKATGRAKRKR